MKKREAIMPVLSLIILSVALVWWYFGGEEERKPPSVSQQTGIAITAEKLALSFGENEIAAEQRYKGKVLAVSGAVQSVGKDILHNPYVMLQAEFGGSAVQCYFEQEQEKEIATLKPAQQVIIKGRCDGQTLGIVIVKECVLQSGSSSSTQSPRLSASPPPIKDEGTEVALHVDNVTKVPVAISTDDFYQLEDAIDADKTMKATALIQSGKVLMVRNDSAVILLEPSHGYLTKIKIKETGRTGWVRSLWLR